MRPTLLLDMIPILWVHIIAHTNDLHSEIVEYNTFVI